MNYVAWNLEADRLKKCIQYSPNVEVEKYFTGELVKHLHIKPTIDAEPTTPLPEITEPSTVEKFGDDIWGEWMNHQHGAVVPVMRGVPCCIWFADGSAVETNAAPDYFWPGVHKYRIAKDRP